MQFVGSQPASISMSSSQAQGMIPYQTPSFRDTDIIVNPSNVQYAYYDQSAQPGGTGRPVQISTNQESYS